FFVEAGVMGLLGGVFGVGIGWLIGKIVTWGTNLYLQRQNLPPAHVFSVPWWLVLSAIAFAILVSLVAGLYPATRAARLNPVEALWERHQLGDLLIVTPDGGSSFYINSRDGHRRYEDFFLREFLPQIEKRYRTRAGRASHGIAGISMGGYGALHLAFLHP